MSHSVPIPRRKPAPVNRSDQSLIDTIFNTANNVFTQIGSIELERYEARRLAEIREAEQKSKIERDETLSGTAKRFIAQADDPNVKNTAFLIGGGMIGLAFLLLLKD